MEFLINQKGNVDDIKCTLSFNCHTREDLINAIEDEKRNKNRKTVINILESKLKKLDNK